MKKTIVLLTIVFLIFACTKSQDNFTADCSGTAKSFATDVSPIFQSSCATNAGCHGTGSSNGPGPLLIYSQIYNARTSIRSAVASGLMPENGSLSSTEKNAIICWIDNGTQNN